MVELPFNLPFAQVIARPPFHIGLTLPARPAAGCNPSLGVQIGTRPSAVRLSPKTPPTADPIELYFASEKEAAHAPAVTDPAHLSALCQVVCAPTRTTEAAPEALRPFPPSVRPGRAQLERRTARKEFRGRRSPVKALHRRARPKRGSRLKRGRFPPKPFSCSPRGPVARCRARKVPGPKAAQLKN